MKVSARELIQDAYKNHYAVPAINVSELDTIYVTFETCQKLHSPVIIQIAPVQVKNRSFSYKQYIEVIDVIAKNYDVKYAVHLDHGNDIEEIREIYQTGFDSIMYDGSGVPLNENIKNTNLVRKYISSDMTLEAEIGVLGAEEGGGGDAKHVYTDLNEAIQFCQETDVDMLAVAVGNSHGIYKQKPELNVSLLKTLNETLKLPLVLHGASGLSKEDIQVAIQYGVAKINFFTDVDFAYTNAFRDKIKETCIYTFIYLGNISNQLEKVIEEKIFMCKSENRI